MDTLVAIRLFTSFYAGFNSLFEYDIKKLIALSTLSHLGFIGIAFFSGLLPFGFFHLLVHALFKSLLFMAIGDIIINMSHYQDVRYLSSGYLHTPFSCFLINVSIFSLLGMPMIRGFYSKDLVLESILGSNLESFFMVIIYLNLVFTFVYSFKLFSFSIRYPKLSSYQLVHAPIMSHSLAVFFLCLRTIGFGSVFIDYVYFYMVFRAIPQTLKLYPLFVTLMVSIFIGYYISFTPYVRNFKFSFFSSMFFIKHILITFSSNLYFYSLFEFCKSFEVGRLNSYVNKYSSSLVVLLSSKISSSLLTPQSRIFTFVVLLTFLLVAL